MLTKLRIKNFKSWQDTGEMRMAPLTMYFGANSSGKSSILQFLLMLKQTAESEFNQILKFNGIVDLGNFKDVIYDHDKNLNIDFSISSNYERSPYWKNENPYLHATVGNNKENLYIRSAEPSMSNRGKKTRILTVYDLRVKDFIELLNRSKDIKNPEQYNETFLVREWRYIISRHVSFINYIGPLREFPKRNYQWKYSSPSDVGQKGEFSVDAILASQINQTSNKNLEKNVAKSLKQIGLIDSFKVKPLTKDKDYYQVLVKKTKNSAEVLLTDVGFGVSQILPVLTSLFYSKEGSTIILEQPEIHLHPKAQAELADVIIEAINTRNIQVIIESHSEHLLSRIQRRIADETFAKDKASLYFCKNETGSSELEELKINDGGDIENWPVDFFGDMLGETANRVISYLERKEKNKKSK